MPWFQDFVSAVELARRQTQAAGQADPVGQYLRALGAADARPLEQAWPGEVVIYDPRAGEVRGHRQVRRFITRNQSWLGGLHARTQTVASITAGGRAVVELLARLDHRGGGLAWPAAAGAAPPSAAGGGAARPGRSGRPSGRPGTPRRGTWSAATRPRWPRATPTRRWPPLPRTGTTAVRRGPIMPAAGTPSCGRSSPGASARAAASAWRTAS